MAKGMYIGNGNVARKIKGGYIGVNGVARRIKKAYIGVNGVARLFWAGVPNFTYTGLYEIVRSTHPTNGSERFYVRFLSSGTLTLDMDADVDVFALGGGVAGFQGRSDAGGDGGGSGYTANAYNVRVNAGITIPIVIGAGTVRPTTGDSVGGTSHFGSLTASGGVGKNGSSGGGGAPWTTTGNNNGGDGGSDGSDGQGVLNSLGGIGQGTTTRPFGGTVAPFNAMLFAPGGGAGARYYRDSGGIGGDGGNDGGGKGSTAVSEGTGTPATAGAPNTGAGGGGGSTVYLNGADGGSGLVMLRWGDWTA